MGGGATDAGGGSSPGAASAGGGVGSGGGTASASRLNDDTGYVQTLYSPNIIEALDAVAPGKYLYLKPKNIHYTTANDDESSIWSNPSIWNRNCLSFDGLTDNALVYAATDAYVTALIARAPCVLAIHPGRGLP